MEEQGDKVNEPQAEYKPANSKKTITFYNSIDEMDEDRWRYLASLTYEQRLVRLEEFRKQIYHSALLPDGTWPLLSRKLTIVKLPYEVCR
ncbi:MAG: hypothetical protein JWO06_2168 [Bacteroidota bacterium]|nr:hypothetical protein [Bacteroidota bacterium]